MLILRACSRPRWLYLKWTTSVLISSHLTRLRRGGTAVRRRSWRRGCNCWLAALPRNVAARPDPTSARPVPAGGVARRAKPLELRGRRARRAPCSRRASPRPPAAPSTAADTARAIGTPTRPYPARRSSPRGGEGPGTGRRAARALPSGTGSRAAPPSPPDRASRGPPAPAPWGPARPKRGTLPACRCPKDRRH